MTDEHELARECARYAEAALSPSNRDFYRRMAAELNRLKAEIERLREAIDDATEILIWCSGSNDFAPGGQAHDAWVRSGRRFIETHLKKTEPKGFAEPCEQQSQSS